MMLFYFWMEVFRANVRFTIQDTVTIKKKRKEKEINGGSEWNLPSPLLLLIIRSPKYE